MISTRSGWRSREMACAALLLVLSPLVAEFLLGDYSVTQIYMLAVLILPYGCGALLLREVARRAGRGWPTIFMLALVYGLIEEGFSTQSLFNPNYLGLGLLHYGFDPALGTSPFWWTYVLGIHVIWSICTPIAIAEGLAGAKAREPWLGTRALVAVGLLYVAGTAFIAWVTYQSFPFIADPRQYLSVLGLVALLAGAALMAPSLSWPRPLSSAAPPLWLVTAVSFGFSTGFIRLHSVKIDLGLGPWFVFASMLAVPVVAAVLFLHWGGRRGWTARHAAAATIGPVLTYGWLSLHRYLSEGTTMIGSPVGTVEIVGQIGLLGAALLLAVWAIRAAERERTDI